MIYRTSIGLDVHARSIAAEANRRLHAKSERLRGRGMRPAKANAEACRLSAAPPPRTGYRKTAPAHGNMGLGGLGT